MLRNAHGFGGLLLTASAIALGASPALAQSQDEGGGGIGQIVVTAEKREQSVQDVPVAVSAFTAERRDVIGINTIQDMTNFTPGLQYNTSTDRISLRGVGRQTNVLSGDASVANYNDGIYETFAVAAGRSTMFLDRVEILRGPQGTLYGRNAIGGAINQISRRPSDEFEAELRLNYGNYDHFVGEAMISGPFPNTDQIRGRLAGAYEVQNEGWIDNLVPGNPDEGGVVDTILIDTQLEIDFSERLDFWMKIAGGEWRNGAGGPGAQSAGWNPAPYPTHEFGVDATSFSTGYGCNPNAAAYGLTNIVNPSGICTNPAANDPWHIARAIPYQVTVPFYYQTAFHLTYHADDFDIKYVTGGVSYHYVLTGPTGTEPNTIQAPVTSYTLPGGLVVNPQESFNYQEQNHFWSHEINLISTTDDPLQWVVGAYYFKQGYRQPVYTTNPSQPQWAGPFPFGVCSAVPADALNCAPNSDFRRFDNQPEIEAESYAAFGQLDWDITDQWHATFGLRYSHDRKWGTESVRLVCFGPNACLGIQPELFVVPLDLTGVPSVVSSGQPTPPRGVVGPTTYDSTTGLATRHYDASWQATSGTLGIQWEPEDGTMAYARYSRGYKSGGLNIGIFTVLSFSPFTDRELVDSFEIGLKRDWSPNFQTNIAAYHYIYENLQIPVTTAGNGGLAPASTTFYNVPEAISQGIEIEALWQPIDPFQLSVSYSYNNTEIQEGQAVDIADPAALDPDAQPIVTAAQCAADPDGPGPLTSTCRADPFTAPANGGPADGGWYRAQSLAGNRLPNAPEHKIAINGNYTWENIGPGELTASLSYVWRGEQYGNLFTRSYNEAPSWDQVDARLTWTADDDSFRVILYGKNLLDEIGYDSGATTYRVVGTVNRNPYIGNTPQITPYNQIYRASTYSVVPPRIYGVELQYRF